MQLKYDLAYSMFVWVFILSLISFMASVSAHAQIAFDSGRDRNTENLRHGYGWSKSSKSHKSPGE